MSVANVNAAPRRGCRPGAGGFSLIELLVAVLVMGIGVLGVTALQLVSLQNNRDALVRGEAVQLAYDMMDRIRANPGVAYGGLGVGDAPPAAPAGFCEGADCSAEQMRNFDQAMWKCQLGAHVADATCTDLFDAGLLPPNVAGDGPQPGLPQGDGAIAVAGDVIQITVRWSDFEGAVQRVVVDSQE